jgi:hypothetical protein
MATKSKAFTSSHQGIKKGTSIGANPKSVHLRNTEGKANNINILYGIF